MDNGFKNTALLHIRGEPVVIQKDESVKVIIGKYSLTI